MGVLVALDAKALVVQDFHPELIRDPHVINLHAGLHDFYSRPVMGAKPYTPMKSSAVGCTA